MRSIIVDDEEQSHEVLKRLLKNEHRDIQVAASAYNVAGGIQLIHTHKPDLIFLDVEMPDGTGFDLLQKVENNGFMVVFITAHNEYAIRAIQFSAVSYLLKPLTAELLSEALNRVREKRETGILLEQLKHVLESFQQFQQSKLPSRMIVSTLEGIHYVPVEDIIRLEAFANSTEIFYKGATKRLVASVNLGAYEDQFRPYSFLMRVHRGHIVNLLMVNAYIKGEGHLVMRDGSRVPVSKEHRGDLLNGLEGI